MSTGDDVSKVRKGTIDRCSALFGQMHTFVDIIIKRYLCTSTNKCYMLTTFNSNGKYYNNVTAITHMNFAVQPFSAG